MDAECVVYTRDVIHLSQSAKIDRPSSRSPRPQVPEACRAASTRRRCWTRRVDPHS